MNDYIEDVLYSLEKEFITREQAVKNLALYINESKYSTVINSLNLINTEPIHTVESALLGDKERLEKLMDAK